MWRAGRKGERLRKNYEVMKRTPRPLIGDQVTTYLLRIRRTFQGKERGRAAVCRTPHCLQKVWPPLLMSCEAPGLKHTAAGRLSLQQVSGGSLLTSSNPGVLVTLKLPNGSVA